MRNFVLPCLLAGLMAMGAEARADELLIANAHIIDPAKGEVRDGSLMIRDGVIVETPADYAGPMLDAKGGWLIPGLNDLHTHAYGNYTPLPETGRDAPGYEGVAKRNLYAGVTGFLDLFGREDALFDTRARLRAGGLDGADLYTSLSCLTAPKGHCSEYGIETRTMSTPDEARATVAALAERHPDMVKIVYNPAGRLPSIDKATLKAAVAEAKAHGLKTVVHIQQWQDVRDCLDAGASAVTHTPDRPVPADIAPRMAAAGMAWIPTLAVETDLMPFLDDPALLDDPLAKALTIPALIAAYRNPDVKSRYEKYRAEEIRTRAEALRTVKAMADAGVTILTGTDAGNRGTIQGYSVHREMAIMVEAGMPPMAALRAATTDAGAFLGRKFGVAVGDAANLVLLDASPLDDIGNTKRINAVVHHGRVVDRRALIAQAP